MAVDDILQALCPTFLLGLDDEEVAALSAHLEPQTLTEGEELVSPTTPNRDLVLVADGALGVHTPAGSHLGTKRPGEWAGEIPFLDGGLAPVGLRATAPTLVLRLQREHTDRLEHRGRIIGRLVLALARSLAVRLRECRCRESWGTEQRECLERALARLYGLPPTAESVSWAHPSAKPQINEVAATSSAAHTLRQRLRAVDLFAGLEESLLEFLLQAATFAHFPQGSVILKEGESRNGLLLVLEGRIRTVFPNRLVEIDEDKQLGPGELCGQLAFVDGGPRSVSCTATEDTTAAIWSPRTTEELLRLGANGQVAAGHFLRWVARQLARDTRRLAEALTATLGGDPA